MTDPKARERLLTILCEKFTDGDMRYQDAADAILSAGFRLPAAPPDLAKKQRFANHYEEQIAFLVERFAEALSSKLRKAEEKYQYQGAWRRAGWASEIRDALLRHVDKGDPLDVAAYCAFAWHHGWSLAPEAAPSGNEAVEAARRIVNARGIDWEMPEGEWIEKDGYLCARYILSLAPGKDVVSGAREVVVTFMMNYDGSKPRDLADLEKAIARFAAEREARVREECCKVVCSLCLANESALAAAQKRVGVLKELAREVAYDDGTRETVSEHNAFPFFSKLNQRMCMLRDKARAALAAPGEQVTNDHRAEERG